MSNEEKEQQEGVKQESLEIKSEESNGNEGVASEVISSKDSTPDNDTKPSNGSEEDSSISQEENKNSPVTTTSEEVSFKVVFNKHKYDVQVPIDYKIKQLKEHLASIINVLPAMQKVMIKGLAKDDKTLKELDVTSGSKVMVVGSKFDDVVNVDTPKAQSKTADAASCSANSTKEPWSEQKIHKKIIEKGVPEDALPGIKECKLALPSTPLSGMVNKRGGKVRLTFKLELDQMWIGTKERTEKINMNHIRQVVSEPIHGKDQYHIMGFQLGTTEASRYWVYWVPAQYVDAIKDTVLGKWQ